MDIGGLKRFYFNFCLVSKNVGDVGGNFFVWRRCCWFVCCGGYRRRSMRAFLLLCSFFVMLLIFLLLFRGRCMRYPIYSVGFEELGRRRGLEWMGLRPTSPTGLALNFMYYLLECSCLFCICLVGGPGVGMNLIDIFTIT